MKSPKIVRSRRKSATGAGNRRGCPLVLIEWEDSRQPTGAWSRLSGFKPADICRCASVGWLIYDGRDRKVLAPNMGDIGDEHNAQMSGTINIPASCITRIKAVREY
jgi:hypothetical protein